MFIDGAAAAYKSKTNGTVHTHHFIHDNRMFAERAFYCMEKKLRRNWHEKRRYDYENGDCPYPGFCGWNAGAFGLSDRYGFESVRFFKGSY